MPVRRFHRAVYQNQTCDSKLPLVHFKTRVVIWRGTCLDSTTDFDGVAFRRPDQARELIRQMERLALDDQRDQERKVPD